MNKSATALGSTLLLVTGAAAGWLLHNALVRDGGEHDDDEGEQVEPADMDVEVSTARATAGELVVSEPVLGVVRADEGAVISLGSRAGGRVAEVLVRPGDDVKAGAPVLRYEGAPLALAVAQAQAALAAAANQVESFDRADRQKVEADLVASAEKAAADEVAAAKHVERQTALLADGLVAPRAVEEARTALVKAKADRSAADLALSSYRGASAELQRSALVAARDAAAAGLADAKVVLADAVVHAPADGHVLAVTSHAGDRVDAGAVVGTLLLPQGRVLVFGLTPANAVGIGAGTSIVWFDVSGARRVAKVRSVSGEVGAATGLVEVIAVPEGAPPAPGLIVRGEIEARPIVGAVLVPSRAVMRHEDQLSVVVIDDGHVAKRASVEVLGRREGVAAVRGDVKAGDRVAIDGAYNLPDGARTHEPSDRDAAEHGSSPEKGDSK